MPMATIKRQGSRNPLNPFFLGFVDNAASRLSSLPFRLEESLFPLETFPIWNVKQTSQSMLYPTHL
jgi:hypothetical protein